MPKVKFKIPSYEEIAVTIFYLVKDKKENYRNNIFIELPEELVKKIIDGELKEIEEDIIQNIKDKHGFLKLEEIKKEIEKIWTPLNNLFFDNLKKITSFEFPFDEVIIYITDIVRGMYALENKVFINPMKNMTIRTRVTAEEIFHLHYWHIFRQLIKNIEIPWKINKEVWEISEVVPEFILIDDLFKPFGWGKNLHRNYLFIKRWKKKLLPVWENKKDFKEFMIKIHEDLV